MTPIYIGETQVSKMHFGNVQDLQKAIFNSVEMSTGTYGGSYNAQETSKESQPDINKTDFTIFKKEK